MKCCVFAPLILRAAATEAFPFRKPSSSLSSSSRLMRMEAARRGTDAAAEAEAEGGDAKGAAAAGVGGLISIVTDAARRNGKGFGTGETDST